MDEILKERELYIDRLRVFATFSVIILHCNAPYFIDAEIYGTKTWCFVNIVNSIIRWGVPIFLMISGKLLINSTRDESIARFIFNRCSRVVLPFFMWSIIYYINSSIRVGNEIKISVFITKFLEKNISYHFWYVYTLFGIYLYVPLFKSLKFLDRDRIIKYIFCVIFITSTVIPFISRLAGIKIFAIVNIFNGYLGWFLFGYIIDKINFSKKYRLYIYILGIIGIFVSVLGTSLLSSVKYIDAFFNGGYQLNVYMIATMVFVFVKYEDVKVIQSKSSNAVFKYLANLSYGVYLIHIIVLNRLQLILIIDRPYIAVIIYSFLTILISFCVTHFIHKITNKSKILSKVLLGF